MSAPEAVARPKFGCPSCGADLHWNPAKTALTCPFCGTTVPAQENAAGEVVEHDLATALRGLTPDQRGWKSDKRSVQCQSCKAISVLDPNTVADRCQFCGAAQLIPYEQTQAPITPESVLPFNITENSVRDKMREWYRSRWFAPGKLKSGALLDTIKGIYLPYWTFDALCDAAWTAEAGYYYWETESYEDSEGRRQTRQVQRVRWQPVAGRLQHQFDDELVSGSKGVDADLLDKIEPFPTKQLKPYAPDFVAGWTVEQYQIDLIAAAQNAHDRMESSVESLCSQQVPGDTQRGLQVSTDFMNQTFKHVLLPVWLLTFVYGSQSYQAIVNGQTGEIAGHYPKSWGKIALLVVGILIGLLVIAMLVGK